MKPLTATLTAALLSGPASAQILRLDLQPTDNREPQPGWTEWGTPGEVNNTVPGSITIGANQLSVLSGDLDVVPRTAVTGSGIDAVLSDCWKQSTRTANPGPRFWTITISDLPAGTYTWTGWHHEANEPAGTPRDDIRILVDEDGPGGGDFVGKGDFTHSTGPQVTNATVGKSTFTFTADGSNDVDIAFEDVDTVATSSQIYLCGFTIYPLSSTGGYETWAAANGIAGEPSDFDFDRDGIDNLVEYALGFDPTAASSLPPVEQSGGTFGWTVPKGTAAAADSAVTYEFQTSQSLDDFDSNTVSPSSEDGSSATYLFPAAETRRFVRALISLQ